jgi:hypothetical protein
MCHRSKQIGVVMSNKIVLFVLGFVIGFAIFAVVKTPVSPMMTGFVFGIILVKVVKV